MWTVAPPKLCIPSMPSVQIRENTACTRICVHTFSLTLAIEPVENLADVPKDQIVETIETSDGPVASTVEYVHEIAKDVSYSLC